MSIYRPSFYKPSKAVFTPIRHLIDSVTNASNALVTTSSDHDFEVNQLVRLHVPQSYGMTLNTVEVKILTIPASDSFTVNLDTTALDSFVTPSTPPAYTEAHVVPITGVENNTAG